MDDEFPDPDEEFDLVPTESLKKINNVTGINNTKVSQNNLTQPLKSSSNGNSRFIYSNGDDFPDPDEEFDLVPTDVYKKSNHAPIGTSTQKTPQCEVNAPKPVNKTQTSTPSDFPDPDEELEFVESTPQPSSSTNESLTEQVRKRTYDDLMKDVADLLQEDIPSSSRLRREKRPRWDQPDLIIEAILNQKQKVQQRYEKDVDNPRFLNSNYSDDPERETITTRVPSWNFVALTRPYDSQRLYVRVKPDAVINPIKVNSSSGLLSVSYDKLKADAEKILAYKAKEKSITSRSARKKKGEDVLWVDKYRPKKYMELLTDETTNREFLRWMKLWNKVVFNREIVMRKKNSSTNNSFKSRNFNNNKSDRINSSREGGFNAYKFGDNYNNEELVDKKGFPLHRIALLSGPPGLGKTTLAHLVARHAGYNVVEINASDDRSPEAFRQALLASTQMKSMIGADPRPNCLVLDEIDGAPAASIELLLKFVQGKLSEKGKKSKSAEKNNEFCKRPIVCICNELYTPALRPLRAVAFSIYVPRITPAALSDRLLTIAHRERLDVDQRVLLQIAEKSGCDVRSCVNALQYMGDDCEKTNLDLSLKDSKGLFEFWKDMFLVPHDKTGPLSLRERVQRVLKSAYSNNSERFVQGIFENYPPNCHDNLNKVSGSLEWFQFYDQVTTVVATKNDWQVMPYTNYAFASWHLGFALPRAPKLSFPYTATEVSQKIKKTITLVSAAQRSCGLSALVIILDLAPLSFELLTPRLRSVAINLYTAKEKSDLDHLIDVMLSLKLALVQDRKEDGSLDYVIEPDLFEIGIFPDCKQRKGLSYTVKQIVSREIEAERVKRAAIATRAESLKENKSASTENAKDEFAKPNPVNRPNHIDRVERITLNDDLKDPKFRDFFKNFKLPPKIPDPTSPEQTSPKDERVDQRIKKIVHTNGVWFKYIEGYSNAVRRTVRMKDIL
ncbi:chromosome transmission fidelity protein 18 homolog [Cotesia typhae]|uniref:chromosome transmission fidelity protein 18 homolog n=1 Tax=Cotesia typhae TaxID=2053667 RepID=UPI003D699AE0